MSFIHFHHLSVDCDHGAIWEAWLTEWSRICGVGEWNKERGSWTLMLIWVRRLYWNVVFFFSKCFCFWTLRATIAQSSLNRKYTDVVIWGSYPKRWNSFSSHIHNSHPPKMANQNRSQPCVSSNLHKTFRVQQLLKHMVKDRQFRDDNQYWSVVEWVWSDVRGRGEALLLRLDVDGINEL